MNTKLLAIVFVSLIISACGSTSSIKQVTPHPKKIHSTEAKKQKIQEEQRLDISHYDTIIVEDFMVNNTIEINDTNTHLGKKYADLIAQLIQEKQTDLKVLRKQDGTDEALVLEGKIISYDNGNATVRFLVGLGAGKAKFDAEVFLKDAQSKNLLGTIDVNQHSGMFGGVVGASLTSDKLMEISAKKIEERLAKARNK